MSTSIASGTITNRAGTTISGGSYGVRISGSPAAVINAGAIGGYSAIDLQAGGYVFNATSGTITGHLGAILANIVNAGIILGAPYYAVRLDGGGSVTNLAGGYIHANVFDGVKANNVGVTITNFGTIAGGGSALNLMSSGNTVENAGILAGGVLLHGAGSDTLIVDAGSTVTGQIARLSASNYLDIRFQGFGPGATIVSTIYSTPQSHYYYSGYPGGFTNTTPGTQRISVLDGAGGTIETLGISFYNLNPNSVTFEFVCYRRGTRILTPSGEVAIEALRQGDLVVTRFHGFVPIAWIGTQHFEGRFLRRDQAPVCFQAHSLGPNIPNADLCVSAAHAMLVGDYLVAASLLVNDLTIVQDPIDEDVEYFHIDLDMHDCVLANGAWGETFWDNGNRADFHNATSYVPPPGRRIDDPIPTCLPIVTQGDDPRLPALAASVTPRLSDRQLSDDADLHVWFDGRRFEPEQCGPDLWQFMLPPPTGGLRLRSRGTRPAMVDDCTDRRRLGFCLFGLEVRSASASIAIALDDPALRSGFHAVERNGARMWRWTDGDATIPEHLLPAGRQPFVLMFRGRHQPRSFVGVLDTMAKPTMRPLRRAAR